jgi:hypothetical protein
MKTKEQLAEKVLFNEITPGIENTNCNAEFYRSLIEKSLTEFSKISDKPMTLQELQDLTNSPKQAEMVDEMLRERLITNEKTLEIAGLQLNRSKLKELLVLPDVSNFLKSIEQFKKLAPSNSSLYRVEGISWDWFTVEGSKVSIDQTILEAFKDERFREFASTPEQIARLNNVLPVCRALNELTAKEPAFDKFDAEISYVVTLDHNNDKFIPHSWFIIHNSATATRAPYSPKLGGADYSQPVEAKEKPLNLSTIHD